MQTDNSTRPVRKKCRTLLALLKAEQHSRESDDACHPLNAEIFGILEKAKKMAADAEKGANDPK